MAVQLMKAGDASATWMFPFSETPQQLNQTHFAQLPDSRIKRALTADYADAAAFAAGFGGQGGECIATQFNMPNRPAFPPSYPTPPTPHGWAPFSVSFNIPGFVGKATVLLSWNAPSGYVPTGDERVSMTIMLGYSASK